MASDLRTPHEIAATSTGGFVSEVAYDNVPPPIDFAFAPDGRIFVADKNGAVRIIEDGSLLPTPFITLPVNTYWDRGLQSIVLDPNFATNGWVYLYYTYENNPGNYSGPKTGQLIRVTADGDVVDPGSTLVLLGTVTGDPTHPSCLDQPVGADCLAADGISHVGGGLTFGPDGMLYLATGDAALFASSFFSYPPYVTRPQELDGLAGKLLRIDPATGAGLPDNPFYTGDPSEARSKVFSFGFRNPFRITSDPASGKLLVADVGSDQWEELNVAEAGGNYGWPCYEGTAEQPWQKDFDECQALYASGATIVHPFYSYAHEAGSTIIGGHVYHGSNYPAEYDGAYFFGDFVRQTIEYLAADPDTGELLPDDAQQLLTGAGSPVDIELGPDGDVYYSTWDGAAQYGQIHHIRYVVGDRPPVAHASASPLGGLAPLAVQFDSAGSSDPDGDPISFAWAFGDGDASTEPSPVHTYAQNGTYQAELTVSDDQDVASSVNVSIVVGNQPPSATILAPAPNKVYSGGQAVPFSGSGHDPETGTLPAASLHWNIILHHCFLAAQSCHTHPFISQSGTGDTLVAPTDAPSDELYYLELRLSATDGAGLSNTASIDIGPATDTDVDGCADFREIGAGEPPAQGGERDPVDRWDYADMPILGSNPMRDRRVRVLDIIAVLQHYGTNDAGGTAPINRNSDPLSVPPATGYHPAFDRGARTGPNPWNVAPPDGQITVTDILFVVKQYYHDCG